MNKDNLDNKEIELLDYKNKNILEKIKVFFINRFRVIKRGMKNFKKKMKYGTFKDKILILLMLGLIALFSLIIFFCFYVIVTAPEISEARLYKNNSTVLYDKNGNEIVRLGTENREKVNYDELPEVLVDAIVATEDSRFFQHKGVDVARFSKAVFGQLLGHDDAGGGSTLTMQVSKNAATNTSSSGIKGLIRKFTDIYLSVFVFEKKYTKEQIMEFYVNIPNLGSGSYGVEQASKTYFGKSVSELTLPEAALIAGLFQAPSAYNPFVYPEKAKNRRNQVLALMYRHGYITEEEKNAAQEIPVESMLVERDTSLNANIGFIDTVVEEVVARTGNDPYTTSMKIYTTMDPEKQQVINDIYAGKTYTWKNDVVQAGIAVVDVNDGSLAAVGAGRNKTAERSFNYATSASRHPGSTAKPVFDYGPAIEYLGWGTGQTIIDDNMTYSSGAYIKNFDGQFKGVLTIKNALAQSRNIPALYTFQQTTNEQKVEFVHNLGWSFEDDGNGTILESCSIGGFKGVTPVESAAAYATFARGGTYIEPYSFTKLEYSETGETFEVQPTTRKAMSEETAYLINMILKYAVTSGNIGAGSVSGTDIAAKTGTSTVDSAFKKSLGIKSSIIGDSWEVAYSPDYAISLWYGYENITKDYFLTNTEGGTARKTITKLLTKGIMKKDSRFKRPSGVVQAEIEIGTDPVKLASPYTPEKLRSSEYFKKGTAPSEESKRFGQLDNPSNLSYSSSINQVTLKWDAAPTPMAVDENALREYYSNNVYKQWVDKYLQETLNYDRALFGDFGYEVYMTNASGTVDLGFTTSNTFTTSVIFDSNTTFTVKSAYRAFKANQSSGITVTVEANHADAGIGENASEIAKSAFTISYRGNLASGNCQTLNDYNNLGSSVKEKIKVVSNGKDITNEVNATAICSENGSAIDCNNMTNGKEYKVEIKVTYNNETKSLPTISIKPSC